MNKFNLFLSFLLCFVASIAQSQPVEMADTMRSEGKIYVVVAILLVIFLGLIGYLVMLDRKITRIEKKLEKKS
jgi:CcmD family protein